MSTLSDVEIETRMQVGQLVTNGDISQIGPSCYELRSGNFFYDLTESDQRIDATAQGTILIKPGHRVVLITMESLEIPDNVIARVFSKGSLFSIGLSPVSTYADPGFSGNLGLVTQNMSDKFIELPIGEAIAKIDFSLLSNPARKTYRGQHGYQTQIWPIKHQLQKSHEDLKGDSRVQSEEIEAYKVLPRATSLALKNIIKKQRLIDISILIAILINSSVLAAVSGKYFDTVVSIAVNLVSSAIVALIIWLSRKTE